MLTFLTESEKYQVGGVKFLKESRSADNLNRGPTFLIMIEVFHKPEQLLDLLDFVQRTREGFEDVDNGVQSPTKTVYWCF